MREGWWVQRDREARAGVGSAEGIGAAGEGAGARFTLRSFWLPRRWVRGPLGAACWNPGLKEGDGMCADYVNVLSTPLKSSCPE